ncbi:MAG: hypothetical protein ACI4S9_05400, partial [Christensenellales bacterium]
MGTIRMKNVNEETTGAVAEAACEAGAAVVNVEGYGDPAVLYEDKARTDGNSRHYVLNNGTAKSIISGEPVNFYDEEANEWKSIDNSLEEKEDVYEARRGKYVTGISKAHKGKRVEISHSGKNLSWEYLGKQEAAPTGEADSQPRETVLRV